MPSFKKLDLYFRARVNSKVRKVCCFLFVLELSCRLWILQVSTMLIKNFWSISSIISTWNRSNEEPGFRFFWTTHQRTLSTSGISRVLEYSIRSSTEYSSSKKLDLHSPSQITEKREDWNQSVYRVDGRQIGRIFSFVVTYASAFERYVYQYLSNCFLPIIFRLLHIHRLIFWFKEEREFKGEGG